MVTTLWQVIFGLASGRTSSAQPTLLDSHRLAARDFSALRYIHPRTGP
ncbi:hypothetical protein [Neorhizobium galegae]|nr:hypothetical protein [Neorhizobium galegae]